MTDKARWLPATVALLVIVLTPHILFAPPIIARTIPRPPALVHAPAASPHLSPSSSLRSDYYRAQGDYAAAIGLEQWHTAYGSALEYNRKTYGRFDPYSAEDAASAAWIRARTKGLLSDPEKANLGLMNLRGRSELQNMYLSDSRRLARERLRNQNGISDRGTTGDRQDALGEAFVQLMDKHFRLKSSQNVRLDLKMSSAKNPFLASGREGYFPSEGGICRR